MNKTMRDKSHEEQIKRWAEFVREHPDEWKSKVKPFMDSQILIARRFYEKILEMPGGKARIMELRGLRVN